MSNLNNSWDYATTGNYMRYFDPFPATLRSMLRYSQAMTLQQSGAGLPVHNLFRCNSIYDPDYTGTGHQPYGHDTLQAVYNHYRVLRSEIKIQFTNQATGVLGITLTDDTTVNGGFDTIREIKGTRYATLASGTNLPMITHSWNIGMLSTDSTTQAAFGANPSEVMFYDVWFEGKDVATTTSAAIVVNIVYFVEAWELRDLGGS